MKKFCHQIKTWFYLGQKSFWSIVLGLGLEKRKFRKNESFYVLPFQGFLVRKKIFGEIQSSLFNKYCVKS